MNSILLLFNPFLSLKPLRASFHGHLETIQDLRLMHTGGSTNAVNSKAMWKLQIHKSSCDL